MVTFRVSDSKLSEDSISDLIVIEILRFIREDEHGLISLLKYELISVIYKGHRVFRANFRSIRLKVPEVSFREFDACESPYFFRIMESIVSMHWVGNVECAFRASFCPVEAKVMFTTCIMRDIARDRWCEFVQPLELFVVESMSWEDFVIRFKREFVLGVEVQ